MTESVTSKEAREARSFIYAKGFNSTEIPPKLFALTAKKLKKPFKEVLRIIAIAKMAGQGVGQTQAAQEYDRNN